MRPVGKLMIIGGAVNKGSFTEQDFDQNVESMIETEEELKEAFNNNTPICIEIIKFDFIYYKLPKTN